MTHDEIKSFIQRRLPALGACIINDVGAAMGVDTSYNQYGATRGTDAIIAAEEVTIRYRDNGPDFTKYFRNDVILFISPGAGALKSDSSFVVGIEIKASKDDLRNDRKIMYYLGHTDFYYLLVSNNILSAGLEKIKNLGDARLGLITVTDKGYFNSVLTPLRQDPPTENLLAITRQALFAKNGITTAIVDMDARAAYHDPETYIRNTGKSINRNYVGYDDTWLLTKQI